MLRNPYRKGLLLTSEYDMYHPDPIITIGRYYVSGGVIDGINPLQTEDPQYQDTCRVLMLRKISQLDEELWQKCQAYHQPLLQTVIGNKIPDIVGLEGRIENVYLDEARASSEP